MSFFRPLLILFCGSLALNSTMHSDARADVEGQMPLSKIQVDSVGLDTSGPIHVTASQSDVGIAQLKVSAFGRDQELTQSQLKALNGRRFNSLGLSYSRGYPDSGGRTVYVLLCQGFSSGMTVVAVVVVSERGNVSVDIGGTLVDIYGRLPAVKRS